MARNILSISCAFAIIALASSHVRMREPPNRSSVWRDERFEHLNPVPNYDDDGLYCGRVHQPPVVETCGVCGDPFVDPTPRPNEHGGIYGQGIITGNYSQYQEFPISVEFTTAHLGFYQLHICDEVPETEACFNRNPKLEITLPNGQKGTDFPVNETGQVWFNTTARFPPGISCRRCVLRLHYRAGNNWGDCEDGTEGMGCGLQETFRSCSDISISL